MKFPVDLLADASLAELERSAHNYMNNLLYSNPDSPEHLTISASTKVTIDISSVGFVPLYGSDDRCKILALFSPSDPFIAVGLYLLDRWWAVEDILKTEDPVRDGVLEVETVGDRIVLYILNRVIYRGKEKTSDELPFLCHGEKDYAKIVWNNGEAVGFYSVKPSGTTFKSFSVKTYQLSVMDSIFVRKCQRRKGFGLRMLVDFVLSFKEEEALGLRYPLTKSMYKVCEKYLCQYPGDADLLWEVEGIGGPNQRTNIARKIMAIDISVSKNLSFSEETLLTPDVAETVLKETTVLEHSVETMEEVTVLRTTKEIDDVPVVLQRSSIHSKQRTTEEKMTEDKSEKVIRIEEIEAETPRKERVSVQRQTELLDSQELEQTEVLLSVYKEKAEGAVDTVPEGGPTMRSNKPAAVLTSGDLAEDHVTSATMTEEQHVEDDATQNLHNKSHDSQITVENVASETQEAEVCEKQEEADIPFGGDAEENILPVELDEETSQKDEETPANDEQVQGVYGEGETLIERRVLRSGKKTVKATTRIKTTKSQDGEQEVEADGANTEGDAPEENRVMRKGRSAATTRQQSKQAQEETEEATVTEEIQVDKTKAVLEETQEITETRDRKTEDKNEEEAEVQKNENPEPEVEIEEIEAEEGVSLRDQDTAEEEQSTAEEEGKIMEMEIKPGNDVEQGEAESAPGEVEDSVLPKSAADSTVVSLNEEEATPSSEEQQNEETVCPISGLQGITVVSVDMNKNVEVHKETATTEEAAPVEKIADEAEEEQREETMEQDKTVPEEQIHDSSMEIEKTEIVKGIVEEEGLEEKVEDTVIVEDTAEGSAEETGGENKTISDNEQTSTVNQTRTPRGRKKRVTAPTEHESVRVLRSGRKSVLATPTRTRKSIQRQIQKDESEEGEESPSAEGTDPEEDAEQTPVIDQEKGEIIENDASQQEETPAAEMDIENMNTGAEEAVTQDVPEVKQGDSTETITEEDAEASVEKADEGMTSDVVEKETVTGPETAEAEESTSEVEETAAGEKSENNLLTSNDDQEEETPVTERRVLRSGKKTVRATKRIKTTKTQDGEQEAEADGAPAEDKEEVASIQECAEETPDEGKVPSDEDTMADETTVVDQTADEAEEESSTANEIHTAETKDNITEEIEEQDGEDDASQKDDTEDTLNTDVDKASDEMETPAVESRVLRSGGKVVPTTPVSVETRILRKGRRSAPATTRRKSKRARIQHQPEEESDEETAPAEELEGEEGEVGQESPEKNEEKAEEDGKIMEMEIKPRNDAEQGEAESAPGEEYAVADAEQTKDSVIEETAVLEGDNGKTDVVETDIIQSSSAEIEETNSTEEEEITAIEKSTVTEVVSDTAIAEEEALDEGVHEVSEEDAPAATTMSLRSKTKTSRTTRRSRGQKTQEPVKTKPQQMEEENVEDAATQEVPPVTDNSPEQREQKEEQTEAEEMLATGQEADEDVAQCIDKETSDSRVGESLRDDTQSADKEEEEKVESDEGKDNMADDVSDNQLIKKLEEDNEEENLENAVEAGEKGSILNSTLDTDEEVETPGVSQIQENDEQNMSEEEMESILIGKRVLRSRTVPSVVITPQSKSRRRSAEVEIAEESSSDEEQSPQSSKRRSLRKRKSTDVTPAHKLRRSSRVHEAQQ